jgi:hypothetical protein
VLPEPPDEKRGRAVTRALVRLGCDDPALVPHLRTLLSEQPDVDRPDPFDVEAAHAIWRLVHDGQPLTEAVGKALGPHGPIIRQEHHDAVREAGGHLRGLVAQATAQLTGERAETIEQRLRQILAARLVWVATGDSTSVLPTVRGSGGDCFGSGGHCCERAMCHG